MIVDYSEMFIGPGRDGALAAHVMLPTPEQDQREAAWVVEHGQGQMVCDLAKKREMEKAENGNNSGSIGCSLMSSGLDSNHQ